MVKKYGFLIVLVLFLGSTALLFFYLRNQQQPNLECFAPVPLNASVVFELKKPPLFLGAKQSKNQFFQQLRKLKGAGPVMDAFQYVDSIAQKEELFTEIYRNQSLVVSLHNEGKDQFRVLFSTQLAGTFKTNQLLKTLTIEFSKKGPVVTSKYNQVRIYTFNGKSSRFYYALHQGFLLASNSEMLLQDAIRQIEADTGIYSQPGFTDVRKTAGNHVDANVYINLKNLAKLIDKVFLKEVYEQNGFQKIGDWVELDLNLKSESLLFNGFANTPADGSTLYNILQGQQPQKLEFVNLVSPLAESISGFGISNITLYFDRLQQYMDKTDQKERYQTNNLVLTDAFGKNYQQDVAKIFKNELGQAILSNGESLFFMRTLGFQSSLELCQNWLKHYGKSHQTAAETFRNDYRIDNETTLPVFSLPIDYLPARMFGPWFKTCQAKFVAVYKDYLIFGETYAAVSQAIYTNVLEKNLFFDRDFIQYSNQLSSKSNYYGFLSVKGMGNKFQSLLHPESQAYYLENQSSIQPFYAVAWQFSNENNRIYNNVLFTYLPTTIDKKETEWETRLDTLIILKPGLVVNHLTQEKEIFVQDAKNQIYLINKQGRILWKKSLNSPIMGTVQQVDYFKNGKLQLLFNTQTQIHLIDRNGNEVERYPIDLESKAVQGLSVVDYEKNRNYRLFIPCENQKIYGYNLEGKQITGFKFQGTDQPITSQVQYFNSDAKDYLTVTDSVRMYIFDRKGNLRLTPDEQLAASPKNGFNFRQAKGPQKACLLRTDRSGNLFFIYFDGRVEKKHFGFFSPNHFFDYEDVTGDRIPDYIYSDSNKVVVFSSQGTKEFELTFQKNIQFRPSYYRFSSNQTAMGIIEKENQKIYLINSEGKLFKGFPLKGISPFSIGIMEPGSDHYRLIVNGDDTYLYNYKLN